MYTREQVIDVVQAVVGLYECKGFYDSVSGKTLTAFVDNMLEKIKEKNDGKD